MQPIHEFGGHGTPLHIAVANGFPPQTYIPFARPFTEVYRVFCLPPRPLWSDEPPPEKMINWRDLVGADLLKGLRDHDMRDVIAVGHSFGGVASMVAVLGEPQRFKALVMLDPPILPLLKLMLMRLNRLRGHDASEGLEQLARNRRTQFDSADAVYTRFKGKGIFADWDDEALREYADSMISDGDGVTLAWSNAWEAYFFRTWILYMAIWRDIVKLSRLELPLLLIRGGMSDTFLPAAATLMQHLVPSLTYMEIPGYGHLFPHAVPQSAADLIGVWLTEKVR